MIDRITMSVIKAGLRTETHESSSSLFGVASVLFVQNHDYMMNERCETELPRLPDL
jgi:hypothetical protein